MAKKVLIADDDLFLRLDICEYLEALGFDPVEASNASNAINLIQENGKEHFLAVVSDMRMPGGSGLRLCQEMSERRANIPTLLHSHITDYHGDGVQLRDIAELKKSFSFVKATSLKSINGDYGYIKEFLEHVQS